MPEFLNPKKRKQIMKPILRFSTSIVFALSMCVSVFAQSQSTTGLIQGNITDPGGAVVQGATVTVSNIETGLERNVTSNSDGFFSAPALPEGDIFLQVAPLIRRFRDFKTTSRMSRSAAATCPV